MSLDKGALGSPLLGNGWCERPAELDSHFESICEGCAHFATNKTFQPVLIRQRDHAAKHGQQQRVDLINGLINNLDHTP